MSNIWRFQLLKRNDSLLLFIMMIEYKESSGFGLLVGQNNQYEDVDLGFENL